MNERLIQSFIDRAALAVGPGSKAHSLVSIVADHCATICECVEDKESQAAEIIRAAFVPSLEKTAVAKAVQQVTH